jgi:ribonuclease H-related protein
MVKAYAYEKQLKEKSSEFISALCKKNIIADIMEDSLREYSIKLDVKDFGTVNLYYKPTMDSYSVSLHEIRNKEKSEFIQKIWNGLNGIADEEIYKNKGYEIDVDGSYQKGLTSYGIAIRKNGKLINELSGLLDKSEVQGSHQIAGEIKAVTESIKWCRENGVNEVTIYYDYKGLEKWANGLWKTKKPVSKNYADFMRGDNIKIHWVKIQSHTGKKWNEYADRLASIVILKSIKKTTVNF